jgi:hypothetical protein
MIDAPRDRANDPARRATPDSQVIFRKGNEAELLNRAVAAADIEGRRGPDNRRNPDLINAERILNGRAGNDFGMTVDDAYMDKALERPIHGDAGAVSRHAAPATSSVHELLNTIEDKNGEAELGKEVRLQRLERQNTNTPR